MRGNNLTWGVSFQKKKKNPIDTVSISAFDFDNE